ncbi:hypothetical protein FB451DRAFT_1177636 [Mycena latifolia]|nr:hypothetical protein FB451DRAFT_1177636 [Mycena latifolia]
MSQFYVKHEKEYEELLMLAKGIEPFLGVWFCPVIFWMTGTFQAVAVKLPILILDLPLPESPSTFDPITLTSLRMEAINSSDQTHQHANSLLHPPPSSTVRLIKHTYPSPEPVLIPPTNIHRRPLLPTSTPIQCETKKTFCCSDLSATSSSSAKNILNSLGIPSPAAVASTSAPAASPPLAILAKCCGNLFGLVGVDCTPVSVSTLSSHLASTRRLRLPRPLRTPARPRRRTQAAHAAAQHLNPLRQCHIRAAFRAAPRRPFQSPGRLHRPARAAHPAARQCEALPPPRILVARQHHRPGHLARLRIDSFKHPIVIFTRQQLCNVQRRPHEFSFVIHCVFKQHTQQLGLSFLFSQI